MSKRAEKLKEKINSLNVDQARIALTFLADYFDYGWTTTDIETIEEAVEAGERRLSKKCMKKLTECCFKIQTRVHGEENLYDRYCGLSANASVECSTEDGCPIFQIYRILMNLIEKDSKI